MASKNLQKDKKSCVNVRIKLIVNAIIVGSRKGTWNGLNCFSLMLHSFHLIWWNSHRICSALQVCFLERRQACCLPYPSLFPSPSITVGPSSWLISTDSARPTTVSGLHKSWHLSCSQSVAGNRQKSNRLPPAYHTVWVAWVPCKATCFSSQSLT